MSRQIVLPASAPDAKTVASSLYLRIADLERAIRVSSSTVQSIEDRSWLRQLVGSTSSDLISISKSQSKINDLMMEMINEVISLNVMSYASLVVIMEDFRHAVNNGMKDSEGRDIKLSEEGKELAEKAGLIFQKIIDGSKDTKGRIDLNAQQIDAIAEDIAAKQEVDQKQDLSIAALVKAMHDNERLDDQQSADIQTLQRLLAESAERNASQAQQIEALTTLSQEMQRASDEQTLRMDALEARLAETGMQAQALQDLQSRTEEQVSVLRLSLRRIHTRALTGAGATALALAMLGARLSGLI